MEELFLKIAGASGGFVLTAVIIALMKGWLVVGTQYEREVANGDKWEERYLQVIGVVQKQAEALKQTAEASNKIAQGPPT